MESLRNAYLAGKIDDDAFNAKTTKLKVEVARVPEAIDAEGEVAQFRGKLMLANFAWSQKGIQNLAKFNHH